MAGRPKKYTVSYFPHYVKWGKTLFILEAQYGNDGYAFWFKLLQILGDTEGHYFRAGNANNRAGNAADWQFLLAKTLVNEKTATEILNLLADLDAIDRELWVNDGVIWSQNFVNGLTDVYRKRCISLPERPNICAGNANIRAGNTPENTQSKVNKSKVNKSKVRTPSQPKRDIYGEFQNVQLSLDEYEKLLKRFGEIDAQNLIDQLSSGIASKGYKYKSHYATIINWSKRDGKKGEHHGGHEQEKSGTGGRKSGWGDFKAITND